MTARDAVLEILAENLPGGAVRSAVEQLGKLAAQEFAVRALPFVGIEAYGTCRRLALYVTGVPTGPQAKVLAQIFPLLLGRLRFERCMTWEPSGFCFPRPVRGLVALHGERLVSFSAAGLRSCRVTQGQEALGPRPVKLASAERYFKTLEHASVLVKDAQRLESMRGALAAASRRMKLAIEAGEQELAGNLYLAEYPVPVVSGFSQEFLSLSPDLVRGALRELLFFPVTDQAGRLQPYFAAFRDGISKGQRNVEDGFRAALESRLKQLISSESKHT
ncbi:MAG: glycine--tRNA ligase subunit beta [Elusimicrobiales bacterium]|nr:glycine--tRNA ligase subunit beta [Elusimicrobiales bacterium]